MMAFEAIKWRLYLRSPLGSMSPKYLTLLVWTCQDSTASFSDFLSGKSKSVDIYLKRYFDKFIGYLRFLFFKVDFVFSVNCGN